MTVHCCPSHPCPMCHPGELTVSISDYVAVIEKAQKERDAAIAMTERQSEMIDELAKRVYWQTMETAPTDGTTIIICDNTAEEPDPSMAHFRDGKWICTTKEDWDAGAPEFREYAWWLKSPTHWMLRPTPPLSSQARGTP